MKEIGDLGEKLVESWLLNQQYEILHKNWHCRWGEIDLIAQEKSGKILAFVEVKTRGENNWDEAGILAITARKQKKIIKTAQQFLATYPQFMENYCRFDVALVGYQNINKQIFSRNTNPVALQFQDVSIGNPVNWNQKYKLTLHNYLASAFESI